MKFHVLSIFTILLIACSCASDIGKEMVEIEEPKVVFNDTELESYRFLPKNEFFIVVSIGHIHSLMKFDSLRKQLYQEINASNPDVVILNGDLVFYNDSTEWNKLHANLKSLNAPYFITAGNHDFGYYHDEELGDKSTRQKAIDNYMKQVGYQYKKIETPYADLILINSNDQKGRIQAFDQLDERNPNKHRILFHHHNLTKELQRNDSVISSWTGTYFERVKLLSSLQKFDMSVHGNWNPRFKEENVLINQDSIRSVYSGNRMKGDSLFFTTIKIYKDSIQTGYKLVEIDSTSGWYD
jgi:3',5'-cyclic AMP phosphodiesterase CpdA